MSSPAIALQALTQSAPPGVVSAIRQASTSTGVDFDYLLQQAATESSFNPHAQAGSSSARGLYQFVDSTWLDMVDKHGGSHGLSSYAQAITRDSDGKPQVADPAHLKAILALRDNPKVSALMAAEFAKDNQVCLESRLGRKVGNTELYMAHFLGAAGATRFLSEMKANPDCAGASVLPAAAHANQGVFFAQGQSRSVDEIYTHFADKFSASDVTSKASPEAMIAGLRPPPAAHQANLQAQAASHIDPSRLQFASTRFLPSSAAGSQIYAALAANLNDPGPRSGSGVNLGGQWPVRIDAPNIGINAAQPGTGIGKLREADLQLLSLRLLQALPDQDRSGFATLLNQEQS